MPLRLSLRFLAVAWAGLLCLPSFAAQELVHVEPSSFSPVVVYEADGERCLTFDSMANRGRQTCISTDGSPHMVLNYTRMMMASLLVQPQPSRILVIGLGGGTLPMALSDLLPASEIDVVEIDPAVARVAQAYFGFKPSARLRVHNADGRAYVARAVQEGLAYDLVLLDAFDENYIPKHLTTQEFLRQVRQLLAPGGVLAANTFSTSDFYDRESATYASVFGEYFNLRSGNRVIFAVDGPLPDDETLRQRAASWKGRLADYGVDIEQELRRFDRGVSFPQETVLLRDGQ